VNQDRRDVNDVLIALAELQARLGLVSISSPSRELSLAATKIQEARMWLNEAEVAGL